MISCELSSCIVVSAVEGLCRVGCSICSIGGHKVSLKGNIATIWKHEGSGAHIRAVEAAALAEHEEEQLRLAKERLIFGLTMPKDDKKRLVQFIVVNHFMMTGRPMVEYESLKEVASLLQASW